MVLSAQPAKRNKKSKLQKKKKKSELYLVPVPGNVKQNKALYDEIHFKGSSALVFLLPCVKGMLINSWLNCSTVRYLVRHFVSNHR